MDAVLCGTAHFRRWPGVRAEPALNAFAADSFFK